MFCVEKEKTVTGLEILLSLLMQAISSYFERLEKETHWVFIRLCLFILRFGLREKKNVY